MFPKQDVCKTSAGRLLPKCKSNYIPMNITPGSWHTPLDQLPSTGKCGGNTAACTGTKGTSWKPSYGDFTKKGYASKNDIKWQDTFLSETEGDAVSAPTFSFKIEEDAQNFGDRPGKVNPDAVITNEQMNPWATHQPPSGYTTILWNGQNQPIVAVCNDYLHTYILDGSTFHISKCTKFANQGVGNCQFQGDTVYTDAKGYTYLDEDGEAVRDLIYCSPAEGDTAEQTPRAPVVMATVKDGTTKVPLHYRPHPNKGVGWYYLPPTNPIDLQDCSKDPTKLCSILWPDIPIPSMEINNPYMQLFHPPNTPVDPSDIMVLSKGGTGIPIWDNGDDPNPAPPRAEKWWEIVEDDIEEFLQYYGLSMKFFEYAGIGFCPILWYSFSQNFYSLPFLYITSVLVAPIIYKQVLVWWNHSDDGNKRTFWTKMRIMFQGLMDGTSSVFPYFLIGGIGYSASIILSVYGNRMGIPDFFANDILLGGFAITTLSLIGYFLWEEGIGGITKLIAKFTGKATESIWDSIFG